jgi:anti-anti-sigma regulatory factor
MFSRLHPIFLLTGAVLLTLLLGGWLSLEIYTAGRAVETTVTVDARLYELRGSIIHLDELLTMSARMAAATGEPHWIERYNHHVPLLDAAIREALDFVPTDLSQQIRAETDAANSRLITIETQALAAVMAGRLADARTLLGSSEYDQQKQVYARGMERLLSYVQAQSEQRLLAGRRQAALVTGVLVIALPLLGGIWLFVLRTFAVSIAARERLIVVQAEEQAMAYTLQNQEVMIAERTAALQSALREVQDREARLRAAHTELEASQVVIRELSAPILPVAPRKVVLPLVGVLDAHRLEMMHEQALRAAERDRIRTLVIDITGVPVIDIEVAHGIVGLVRSLRLMGVEAVLAGISPEVAQAIVSLGLSLEGLRTYHGLHDALQATAG